MWIGYWVWRLLLLHLVIFVQEMPFISQLKVWLQTEVRRKESLLHMQTSFPSHLMWSTSSYLNQQESSTYSRKSTSLQSDFWVFTCVLQSKDRSVCTFLYIFKISQQIRLQQVYSGLFLECRLTIRVWVTHHCIIWQQNSTDSEAF